LLRIVETRPRIRRATSRDGGEIVYERYETPLCVGHTPAGEAVGEALTGPAAGMAGWEGGGRQIGR